MHILIAEDEFEIANSLKRNFTDEGHTSVIAQDGLKALEFIASENFDLLLLDWRMPHKSGIEIVKEVRSTKNNTPIILLTALTDVSNKVEALHLGADDYITKPFSFAELTARIDAVLRRYHHSSDTIMFDGAVLDLIEHTLSFKDKQIKIPDKEFELLYYLIQHKNKLVSRSEICREVWKLHFDPHTNIIDVTVRHLRKKIEDLTAKNYIKSVYGEGYTFITD